MPAVGDPMDITANDSPYDRVRFGEAVAESIRADGSPFGKGPKEVRVSYTPADPQAAALAATLFEVVQECSKLKTEQFTAAMREEGLPEETVQRVLNRVTIGHPGGLEHWSREVERAAAELEGRFTDTEEDSR